PLQRLAADLALDLAQLGNRARLRRLVRRAVVQLPRHPRRAVRGAPPRRDRAARDGRIALAPPAPRARRRAARREPRTGPHRASARHLAIDALSGGGERPLALGSDARLAQVAAPRSVRARLALPGRRL